MLDHQIAGCSTTMAAAEPVQARSAVDRTLNIHELLEEILLALPAKDILFVKRVCKNWNEMIEGSSRLQEALYVKPVKAMVLTEPPKGMRMAENVRGHNPPI